MKSFTSRFGDFITVYSKKKKRKRKDNRFTKHVCSDGAEIIENVIFYLLHNVMIEKKVWCIRANI